MVEVAFEGLTATDYFLGNANKLTLGDLGELQDVEITVDNNGISNVIVNRESLCQNVKSSARADAVKLEGQQNVMLDLQGNGNVTVTVENAIITVVFGNDNSLCFLPIDFAYSVEIELTASNDWVHIVELSTILTLKGNEGNDTIIVDFTSADSFLNIEASPNDRTEVKYTIDNITVGNIIAIVANKVVILLVSRKFKFKSKSWNRIPRHLLPCGDSFGIATWNSNNERSKRRRQIHTVWISHRV